MAPPAARAQHPRRFSANLMAKYADRFAMTFAPVHQNQCISAASPILLTDGFCYMAAVRRSIPAYPAAREVVVAPSINGQFAARGR